jgi:hypothetical protein
VRWQFVVQLPALAGIAVARIESAAKAKINFFTITPSV